MFNVALVALGTWCATFRVRPNHRSATGWIWFWIVLELANGVVHLGMAAMRGAYFPGAATAPILFLIAAVLAYQLTRPVARQPSHRASP